MMRKSHLFVVIILVAAALLFSSVAADPYVGGEVLKTVQDGIVSGGLWFDSEYGFNADQKDGVPNSVEKEFALPAFTDIKWARLYVAVYCGHMQNNYQGQADVSFNGGGGKMNLGSELLNVPYVYAIKGGSTPVYVNDHCNRVTSDYLMWYDVTDQITSQSTTAYVSTKNAPGYTEFFDGRIKLVTLVVAYDDGDNDEVYYWINQGHDVHSYYIDQEMGVTPGYTGETPFETKNLPDDAEEDPSAKMSVVYLASNNGEYTFNGMELDPTTPLGSYSGYQTWDVTDSIDSFTDSEMTYTRDLSVSGSSSSYLGAFYKIPLAMLSVKYPGPDTGDLTVESVPQGATIILDGDEREEVTDATLYGIDSGTHTVTVALDGYQVPDKEKVEIEKGKTASASFVLEPITGSVTVSSEPAGASIYIDGVDTGKVTEATIDNVVIGDRIVEVRLDGYEIMSKSISIEEDSTAEVSFAMTVTEEDDAEYGYDGKPLEKWMSGSLNGGVYYTDISDYTGILKTGEGNDYTLDVELPENAEVQCARLYVYSTWSHDTSTKDGVKPKMKVTINDAYLSRDMAYADRKGEGIYNYVLDTDCYDVTEKIPSSGSYDISIENTGNSNDVFALYGVSVVVVYADSNSPLIRYWVMEGCDSLLASDEFETTTEDCTTSAEFSGTVSTRTLKNATLMMMSTAASGVDGDEHRITFNDWEAFNLLTAGSSAISSFKQDVKPFIKSTGNKATIQSFISGTKGDYMENRNMILILEYSDEISPEALEETEITGSGAFAGEEESGGNMSSAGNAQFSYAIVKPNGYAKAQHVDYANGTVEIYINEGTVFTDSAGLPVDAITINHVDSRNDSVMAFELGPTGTAADLSVILTVREDIPGSFANCSVVRYTEDGGSESLPGSYDEKTGLLSCRINEFGIYGIVPEYNVVYEEEVENTSTGNILPRHGMSMDHIVDSFLSALHPGRVTVAETDTLSLPAFDVYENGTEEEISGEPTFSAPEVTVIDSTRYSFNLSLLSNPEGARIFLDGEYTGKITPYTLDGIPGGSHTVGLELEGFHSFAKEVYLSDNTELSAEMESRTGSYLEEKKYEGMIQSTEERDVGGVYVTSSPDGAMVYIDGVNTGMTTPCIFSGFKEGLHTVKVKSEEDIFPVDKKKIWIRSDQVITVSFGPLLDISSTADIESDYYDGSSFTVNGYFPEYKIPKAVKADLGYSFITIYHEATEDDPLTTDGAQIRVNDNESQLNDESGTGGYTGENETVRNERPGENLSVDSFSEPGSQSGSTEESEDLPSVQYLSHTIHVTGDDDTIDIVPRNYTFGKVWVDSKPAGAKIYVDGYDTEYCTPYAVDGISDGRHIISVLKAGYIGSEKKILFLPDSSEYDEKIEFTLESYPYGSLEVTSQPSGAKIYLYRKNTGKTTPYTFRYMDLGAVEVRAVSESATKTRTGVVINPYELTTCHIDLTEE